MLVLALVRSSSITFSLTAGQAFPHRRATILTEIWIETTLGIVTDMASLAPRSVFPFIVLGDEGSTSTSRVMSCPVTRVGNTLEKIVANSTHA